MNLRTYIPSPQLAPYVKSFAIHETTEENTYQILPDTSLVIGFQYHGRLSRIEKGTEQPLSISGVSGLADQRMTFRNSANTGTVLMFFQEAGAAPFFRQPLHELFRESVSLDNFMLRSELLCLEEQLAESINDSQRITVVEQFLIRRITDLKPDPLVFGALSLIHKSKGTIRISELTEQLHTSRSPLEKRFRQVVGATPKKFASIVRLKHIIRQYQPSKSLTELGYEIGFYDQAHFIKEFKSFTGKTPEQFFAGQP